MSEQFLTPEGLKKIKNELKELTTVRRPKLVKRIKHAKELGDLSENADYQSAKDDQGFMEGRILQLKNLIKTAIIIKKKNNNWIIGIGSEVKIDNGTNKFKYTITGSNEADPLAGKVSNESPLGKAMLKKKVGDSFSIITPNGEVKYKILEVK